LAKKALEGLKVLDIGNIIAGPWCSTIMADFGAEVIKVEMPGSGDMIRSMGRIKDMWYTVENRNKKNITLNLKTEYGKKILTELIQKVDILVENFRPGAFDRMGFTWEKLHKINPRLIYVAASGYGRTGPEAHKPGFDRVGLAKGGFLEVTGEAGGPPIKPGLSVADFYTALFGCVGAMFAIYNRDIVGTGKGQMIDACLAESALRIQECILTEYSYDGTIRTRIGNGTMVTVPSGHFLTKDNKYLVLSVSGDKLFKVFADACEMPELAKNPKYSTGPLRTKHREEINDIAKDWISKHTIAECLKAFGDDIPCGKVNNVADIMTDEQYNFRNDIIDVVTKQFGTIKMQNVTPKMSGTPGEVEWAGMPLGTFNEEIYGALGYSKEEIADLAKKGII